MLYICFIYKQKQKREAILKNSEDAIKKSLVGAARRIVIKVGSTLVQSPAFIEKLATLLGKLKKEQRLALIVSSGAYAGGLDIYTKQRNSWQTKPNKEKLSHQTKPELHAKIDAGDHAKIHASAKISLSRKQAFAAIGQVQLMESYRRTFSKEQLMVGQILISKFSIDHRDSYLNARNTLAELWQLGVIPIINENDSLATDGLRFGNNDVLGALVCGLADADLYVMLSDVDGFYVSGKKVSVIEALSPEYVKAAKGPKSARGSGGMITKLNAVSVNKRFAIPTLLSPGYAPGLYQSIFGEVSGTMFLPSGFMASALQPNKNKLAMPKHTALQPSAAAGKAPEKISSRKRWLVSNVNPAGSIVIDKGAVAALQNQKSLLPGGIVLVKNTFRAGDVCNIVDEYNAIIARGLSNYDSKDLQKIQGLKSSHSKNVLDKTSTWHEEAVHKNNLVLFFE